MNMNSPAINQAFAHMDKAKAFLLDVSLPPNPVNYWVAYEYCQGKEINVVNSINEKISNNRHLDPYFFHELYNDYFLPQPNNFLVSDMDHLAHSIVEDVSANSKLINDFSATLEQQCQQLQQTNETDTQQIAAEIIQSSLNTAKQQQQLAEKLIASEQQAQLLIVELQKAQLEAITDELTGLYNRKGMDKKIHCLEQEHSEFAVMILDIDHFKQVNDQHGHLLGDRILQQFGQIIRNQIRGEDLGIRFGGEEFVVILPSTSMEGAAKVAHNIRNQCAKLVWKNRKNNQTIGPVSMSIGIYLKNKHYSWQQSLSNADQALYTAKDNGRDQVIIYPDTLA